MQSIPWIKRFFSLIISPLRGSTGEEIGIYYVEKGTIQYCREPMPITIAELNKKYGVGDWFLEI